MRHVRHDLSDRRRVLAAGDVHGEYGMLEDELARHGFDPGRDMLVLLGDLADRGPESAEAPRWCSRPGVLRVLGNHDLMPGMLLSGQASKRDLVSWGGAWYADLPADEVARVAAILEDAPTAMTVRTPGGREIGVVHADCLPDWRRHVEALEDEGDPLHARVVQLSLWRRDTIVGVLDAHREGRPIPACSVTGVDHVFHGHTHLARALRRDDRTWLDTGACYGGVLTVMDVDLQLDAIGLAREAA